MDESTPPQGEGSIPNNPGATLSLPTQHINHYLRSLGTPAISKVVNLPKNETSKKARLGLNLAPYLKSLLPKSAKDNARHFLVGVRRLDGSTQRHYALVQVTDLALASVEQEKKVRFVVTSLQTGKPVPRHSPQTHLANPVERDNQRQRICGSRCTEWLKRQARPAEDSARQRCAGGTNPKSSSCVFVVALVAIVQELAVLVELQESSSSSPQLPGSPVHREASVSTG